MNSMQPRHWQLLESAVCEPGRAAAAWRHWRSGAEIEALDGASLSLLPLVYRRQPEWWAEDPWCGRVSGLYRRNWYWNQRLFAAAAVAFAALRGAGIEAMVAGDLATLQLAALDPGVLKLDALALMVREVDRAGASEVLALQGWAPMDGGILLPGLPASMHTLRYAHGVDGRINLRTRLSLLQGQASGCVWETMWTSEIAGQTMYVPGPEAHLAWILLACAAPFGILTLVRLAGAALLVDRVGAALDWERFLRLVREDGMAPVSAAVFAMISRLVPSSSTVLDRLTTLPATPAERSYASARAWGGLRHDWALYQIMRERGELTVAGSSSMFMNYLWGKVVVVARSLACRAGQWPR